MVTTPSIHIGTVKKVRSTDDCGKTKSVANERELRGTVAHERDRSSGWYSSHCQRWESHNNKRLMLGIRVKEQGFRRRKKESKGEGI
jgi:hypothetical protein